MVSRAILALLGKSEHLLQLGGRSPGARSAYRVDPSKLLGLGWVPRWRFSDGLADPLRWYASNSEWWRAIKSGAYRAYYEHNYVNRARLLTAAGSGVQP